MVLIVTSIIDVIIIATKLIFIAQNWTNRWSQSFASIEINLTGLEMIFITTGMIDDRIS